MSEPLLVYVVGEPGSGKSTLVKGVCEKLGVDFTEPLGRYNALRFHMLNGKRHSVAVLGDYNRAFGGTDTLSMSVISDATNFLPLARKTGRFDTVLAEGDRLSSVKFFFAARDSGWQVEVFHLKASSHELERRYAERGSSQDVTWLAGRKTKVRNLVKELVRNGFSVHSFDNETEQDRTEVEREVTRKLCRAGIATAD